MEADDLLCSRNARSEGQSGCSPQGKLENFGRPSPGILPRHGKVIAKQSEGRADEKYLPVGGQVRRTRAVENQSAPIPERQRASFTTRPPSLEKGI